MSTTFFTDRNLGRQFPEVLRSAGMLVERHADHFVDDAADEEWIHEVAKRGWVALSHDKGIRRRPNEREAVFASGLALIVIVGRMPFPEVAAFFARSRAAVERFVKRNEAPWIARFYVPSPAELAKKLDPAGHIELWLRAEDR